MKRKQNPLIQTAIFVAFSLVIMLSFGQKKAHAVTLVPDPGGSIPGYIRSDLMLADTRPQTPSVVNWISEAGNAANTQSVPVTYGQSSVALQYNFAYAIGFEPQLVSLIQNHIYSASATPSGSVGGIAGQSLTLFPGFNNVLGGYGSANGGFTFFAPPGGFTSDVTYTVWVRSRFINAFSNGFYQCVDSGADAQGGFNYQFCGDILTPIQFRVHVSNPSPPKANISCDIDGNPTGATISWDGTPGNFFGINWVVEIDDNGNWGDGFFNKAIIDTIPPFTTNAPVGFNPVAPKVGALTLVRGNTYTTRVTNGQYSNPTSFVYDCPPLPQVSLQVNGVVAPDSIEVNDPIKVSWQSKNSTTCSASGSGVPSWSGAKALNVAYPPGEDHTSDSATTGIKSYTITCTGPGGSDSKTVQIIVANKPYLRVYGGDVLAGGSTKAGTVCTTKSNAGIITYNKGAGGGYAGAGTQYASQAMADITEFASSALRAPPKDLSFANTAATPYGGSFGGSAACAMDYYSTAPDAATFNTGGGMNVNALASGKVGYKPNTPPLIINTGGVSNVGVGVHAVLYVDGDAYIHNSIFYAGSGGWTSLADIPSFYLVVKGDIYIDKTVTNLDGVYVAQSNGATGGHIYTCAQNGSQYTAAQLGSNCANQLVVNGAFIAKQVKFQRTSGTLKSSAADRSKDANIAEKFIYGPELWLVNPGILPSSGTKYNSITSLPPVL